jgi:YidC/Oxa1 family membrane protein insertase
MESGRFLLAVVLMIAVVILTNILLPPSPAPETAGFAADSTMAATGGGAADSTRPPANAPRTDTGGAPPAPGVVPTSATPGMPSDTVVASSPMYRYGFLEHGGDLVSAELLEYKSFGPGSEGQNAELHPAGEPGLVRHRIRSGNQVIDLSSLPFRASAKSVTVDSANGSASLELSYADSASGLVVMIRYTFHPDSYVIDVDGVVRGLSSSPQVLIDMGPTLQSNEAVLTEDVRALAYVVNSQQTGIHSELLAKLKQQRIENGPLTWVAIKNKYFLIAAMEADSTPTPFGGVIAQPTGQPNSANLTVTLGADADGRFAYRLYAGPRESDHLSALGNNLQDVTVFGWRFLQPVLRPLGHAITWVVLQLHRVLGLGYGWVLILFGFLIRFVLWPLNARAMRSQLKNMEIQPRLKEIQTRYKSDPQKLQQEMLKLYKEEGHNPMGGCLPMLLPLPVLITLFFVFQSTIEFRGVSFLWLPDLARKDPLYILPVALGLSMFIQQWLNMRATKDAPAQMKYMTYFMPIFMTFLFLNFASGLNLYYASMNIASVPQQLQIMKEKQRRLTKKPGKS